MYFNAYLINPLQFTLIIEMPNIRTNLLRIEINSKSIVYQVDIACKIAMDVHHHQEVAAFLSKNVVNSLYSFPYLYASSPLIQLHHALFLSNGTPLQLQFVKASEGNGQDLIHLIAERLMTITDLLYSPQLHSCFNPFEEKRSGQKREIPGYSIQPSQKSQTLSLYLVPLVLHFNLLEQIGEDSQVLLDYYSGNFCLKQNIVRIDKARGEVHFRDGSIINRAGLKPITVKTIGGYPLAHQLYNFIKRVKDCSLDFCQSWAIKFDSRFLESAITAVHPGTISFRNNYERSLSDIVTPMNEHNWQHNWIEFFRNACLDDALEGEIVVLTGEGERGFVGQLVQQIDAVRFRMGINLTFKNIVHNGLEMIDQLVYSIRKESSIVSLAKVYLVAHNKAKTKQERQNFQKLIAFLIELNVLFHLVQVDSLREHNFEVLSYQHLSILYSKFRLNPWKIKNIPFSNAPMAVMTLHVQTTRQGLLSVALLSTMNLFLTKFTAVHKLCKPQTLKTTIEQSVRECISKFHSAHNRTPTRIFAFRTGLWCNQEDLIADEHKFIKESIFLQTSSLITYVCLSKEHSLRTFTQLDSNYVSRDTCKKVQNLLYTTIKDDVFMQLELQQPMHKVKIYEIQKIDPNFVAKVLQLTAKVVFSGVGNNFGRGLGLIDYSRKLNTFREYNLQPWRLMLRDGILPFL